MSEGNVYVGAASGPVLHRRFTHPFKVTKSTHARADSVGMTKGRIPPTQATTNFQTVTNPVNHVRIPPQASARGNQLASSNMRLSMVPAFSGKINVAVNKPQGTNSNAAPPWLRSYGPSITPSAQLPSEASQFAMGGGGPALLRNKNNPYAKVWRLG